MKAELSESALKFQYSFVKIRVPSFNATKNFLMTIKNYLTSEFTLSQLKIFCILTHWASWEHESSLSISMFMIKKINPRQPFLPVVYA